MAARYCVDASGSLSNVRRTAVGGLLVDATLARVGVLEYVDADGALIRRYNPASVLQASLDQLTTVPVTNRHPQKFVDVDNYKKVAAGHVVGVPTFKDGHIHATLAIQDAQLIQDIEMGVAREVSMGYMAGHDGRPGTTDDGQTFDESRTDLTWNHAAIVPAGRAGKTVRLMLDSAEIPSLEIDEMEIKIGDKTVPAAQAQATFDEYDAGLQGKLAQAEAARDAALAQVSALTAELAEATSDAAIDARIAARDAAKAAADAKAAKLARVAAAYPSISLDGRSEEFVDGLFASLPAETPAAAANNAAIQSNDEAPGAPKSVGKTPIRAKSLHELRREALKAEASKK